MEATAQPQPSSPPIPLPQLPPPPPLRPQQLQLQPQKAQAQPAVPPRPAPAAAPAEQDDPAEMIYCSVDEMREWGKKREEPGTLLANNALNTLKSGKGLGHAVGWPAREHRDVLHEISLNSKVGSTASSPPMTRIGEHESIIGFLYPQPVPKVAQRVAQWERRVLETRTEQILSNLKRRQQEAAREAEEMAPVQERLWQEQGEIPSPGHTSLGTCSARTRRAVFLTRAWKELIMSKII